MEIMEIMELEDQVTIDCLDRLINVIGENKRIEHPWFDREMALEKTTVWPDLFWAASKVALFLPEHIKQYEVLKKYNWHCYLIFRILA